MTDPQRLVDTVQFTVDRAVESLKHLRDQLESSQPKEVTDLLHKLAQELYAASTDLQEASYDLDDYHHIDDCDDNYEDYGCDRIHVDDEDADKSDIIQASKNALGAFYKVHGRVASPDESMDDYQIRMVFDTLDDALARLPVGARIEQARTFQKELV